jgi:hypothetical protein
MAPPEKALNYERMQPKPKPPTGQLARLRVPPHSKRVYKGRAKNIDIRTLRMNGKDMIGDGIEPISNQAINDYRSGVIVKIRNRHGKVRMVVVNTSNKPTKVGMRYKRT